jgi:RNA polymerase sigma-70 factor (ECF subfamily)
VPTVEPGQLTDQQVVQRVLSGDVRLFEVLMRRYNKRVFRAARGILKNDEDAEDAGQDTWIAAYRGLAGFDGRAAFSTWLTRIAIRRALARVRSNRPVLSLEELDHLLPRDESNGPEWHALRTEMARVLEAALSNLRPSYRIVIVLRDLEHMSTAEAAEVLGVSEDNLRVRLHRARGTLGEQLVDQLGRADVEAFAFDGERCNRMVERVFGVVCSTHNRLRSTLESSSPRHGMRTT